MTRRHLLLGGAAAVLVLAGVAGSQRELFYAAITERRSGEVLDAPTAHARATAGELILVDIRRPDEWAETGRPEASVPLDMRREDFAEELRRITAARGDRPVALICARGVRSARLANRLIEAGFDNVVDVPEGMLGSAAGPGWIERGLPREGPG